jgi:hypothetical protein
MQVQTLFSHKQWGLVNSIDVKEVGLRHGQTCKYRVFLFGFIDRSANSSLR